MIQGFFSPFLNLLLIFHIGDCDDFVFFFTLINASFFSFKCFLLFLLLSYLCSQSCVFRISHYSLPPPSSSFSFSPPSLSPSGVLLSLPPFLPSLPPLSLLSHPLTSLHSLPYPSSHTSFPSFLTLFISQSSLLYSLPFLHLLLLKPLSFLPLQPSPSTSPCHHSYPLQPSLSSLTLLGPLPFT